jgi:hypothetical protein
MQEDKRHTHASKHNSVGIVGEGHIWDGPLGQEDRIHGQGSSNGSKGMKLKLGGVPYIAGSITSIAQG